MFSRDADVLFSTELVFYYKHMVRELIAVANDRGFQVIVIAYLRRQDRMVVPTYYQNIRNHGFHGNLPDFIGADGGDAIFPYHEVIWRLRCGSAPNRLVLRTFEPEFLEEGDIVARFHLDTRPDGAAQRADDRSQERGSTRACRLKCWKCCAR